MLAHAHALLRDVFGYERFRAPQDEVIATLMAGGDALVLMPTGGGKSLCYQIPAIARPGTGIVVSPLIALMQDQVAALKQAGVHAAYLNSALNAEAARAVEQQLLRGELDLLYVAPERLMLPRTLDLLARTRLALFAIDEAHCVSQWGHDFRPEYMQLSVLHERFPDVPRIALTATADEPTRREIIARLGLEQARVFISGFDRPNIRYRIAQADGGRGGSARDQLLRFIRTEHAGDAGIVYCLSRKRVDEIALWLAGRDGLAANAWMIYGLQDVITLRQMLESSEADEQHKRVERHKLDAMLGLCEISTCRRQALLAYFNDALDRSCGNCDTCLHPPETWDATVPAQKALSCVHRTGQRFGVNYLIDVLMGKDDDRIRRFGHDKLSTSGIGKELGTTEWRGLFC